MKLATVLAFVMIAVVVEADNRNSQENRTSEHRISQTSSSAEQRWRPIFPNARKFVVTMKPTQDNSPKINRVPKKPLMLKIIPKEVTEKYSEYRKGVTRQPLMKFNKFTVKPLTATRYSPIKTADRLRMLAAKNSSGKDEFKKKDHVKVIVDDNSQSSSEEKTSIRDNVKDNNNNHGDRGLKRTTKFPLSSIRVNENMETRKETTNHNYFSTTTAPFTQKPHTSFSSEEEEDRREFIFIKPKTTTQHSVKATHSSESTEITTEVASHARRLKRSINVIVEENLGATVSGFKFTGKPASLSSDLVFKNINI